MGKEEISQIAILDVANKLGLSPAGKICSCFNKSSHKNGDRNPSLSFDIKTNRFKCFACGVSGNNIELVKQVKSIDFKEAISWIKNTFNDGSDNKPIVHTVLKDDKKVTAKDIEIYNKLFAIAGDIDNRHWVYLNGRGLSKLVLDYGVTNVKVGTAEIIKNLFPMEELLHSGVFSISKNKKEPYFTFFSHTLLFPFYHLDDVLYIQGRTLENSKFKYRNLAKEITYPYNVNILLHSDISNEEVRITEGVIDTLTLLDNSLNAIGVIGAGNFKKEWVKLFDRYNVTPVIAFDNDDAGVKGAKSVVNIFKRDIKNELPIDSKDWNGCIKKN